MKRLNIAICTVVLLALFAVSCDKDPLFKEGDYLYENNDLSRIGMPTVITGDVIFSATCASCDGIVKSDGGNSNITVGICWNSTGDPTINDMHTTINGCSMGQYTSYMEGLEANHTYYVRAYVTNPYGTAYGDVKNFTTTAVLTDIEGNTYETTIIGRQIWMRENLRTKKYADGTTIAKGSSTSSTTGYWYYPSNSSSNMSTYGLLYNWKAVMRNSSSSSANPSGVQGICPTGWHVPSDAEWKQMEMAVGMSQSKADGTGYRGNIAARLCGNTGWTSSSYANAAGNTSATGRNSSGFSVLPAGIYDGYYYYFGDAAYFWSATEGNSTYAYRRGLYYNNAGVRRSYTNESYGFSVRCVRD